METASKKKVKLKPQLQLNPKWTKDCRPEEIEEVKNRLIANADLFLLLDKIVLQKLSSNSITRRSKSAYDKPAYSEFQADCNGYERALEEVRIYLKLIKEK